MKKPAFFKIKQRKAKSFSRKAKIFHTKAKIFKPKNGMLNYDNIVFLQMVVAQFE